MDFAAPIPGMSLTREPGNAPWEQPPLFNTAEESLGFYLEKLDSEERLDDLLFALESGYPVDAMVDMMTSYSVMEGYHSFDVKMLISPLLHEYIISLADAAGIEYIEFLGPSKEERNKARDTKRQKSLLLKSFYEGPKEPSEEKIEQAEEMLEPEDSPQEEMDEGSLIKRRM